ncbi:MAG TPA: SpoIIIAH-like family protein, partial [Syntrophomonadaceae bacterium]|nr:SpoIIIAH-like family protein [Syntrophomonadaceae bacterium]
MLTINKRTLYSFLIILLIIGLTIMIKNYNHHNTCARESLLSLDSDALDIDIVEQIGKTEIKGDFFAEYRMERERLRGKQIELLKSIISHDSSEEKARTAASLRLVEITREMEKEMQAENIIKSRGYEDCVIILQPEATTIIIQRPNLSITKEKELRDLVAQIAEISPEKVVIIT